MEIWARLGIKLDVNNDEGAKILNGDEQALSNVLAGIKGDWRIDGEAYIPQPVVEGLKERYPDVLAGIGGTDVGFDLSSYCINRELSKQIHKDTDYGNIKPCGSKTKSKSALEHSR